MSHQKNGYVHPLFDPTSNYRVASRGPVWGRDGGRGSVKRFFLDHLRDVYLQWPMIYPPEKVPQGIFPPDVYKFHWDQSEPVPEPVPPKGEPVDADEVPARGSGEVGDRPGVVRLNLEHPGPASETPTVDRYRDLFAGDNRHERANREGGDFWLEIDELPPLRRCVVLILGHELQIAVARECGRKEWDRHDESAAILAMTEAFEKMVGNGGATERELAFRLAALFSLAPGLEGNTGGDGIFSVEPFELSHPQCLRMPDAHLLFCCTGPALPPEVPHDGSHAQ